MKASILNITFPYQLGPRGPMPVYWANETSGVMRQAVEAYLAGTPDDGQLALIIAYSEHWIDAPGWKGDCRLFALQERIKTVATLPEMRAWLSDALDVGIDPL